MQGWKLRALLLRHTALRSLAKGTQEDAVSERCCTHRPTSTVVVKLGVAESDAHVNI